MSQIQDVETVIERLRRWTHWLGIPTKLPNGKVRWSDNHASARHARDMANLFKRAVEAVPDYATLPADEITEDQIIDWAERWAIGFVERKKRRGDVNKLLRHTQTAWSEPWGKRRA